MGHDVLQKHVYWYWVKSLLDGGQDVGRVLKQVAGGTLRTLRLLSDGGEIRAGWTTCRDDHNRLVLVDVVHDRLNKGLDVECGDVPHVHRCEMLVKDCDALGVDFPAHGQHWLDPEVKEGQAGGPDPVEEAEVHRGTVCATAVVCVSAHQTPSPRW